MKKYISIILSMFLLCGCQSNNKEQVSESITEQVSENIASEVETTVTISELECMVSVTSLPAETKQITENATALTEPNYDPSIPEMTFENIDHNISDYNSLQSRPQNINTANLHFNTLSYPYTDFDKEVTEAAIQCVKESDNYKKTAEALKKSKGRYYLGGNVTTAETNEKFEPNITVDETVSLDFDDDGNCEHFVIMNFFDLAPEFIPYKTTCCVYVSSDGKAELLIPKSVGLSISGIIQGEEICHIAFDAGCNNTTSFFSIYSVKDGIAQKELEEWNYDGIKDNGTIVLISQLGYYGAVYDLDKEEYVVFADDESSVSDSEES